MLKRFFLLFLMPIVSVHAHDRVLLITHAYNQPDFIQMQAKTFKKFMQDEYEFVVFNDAKDTKMAHQIQAICAECGVRCIRVPQEIHDRPYLKRGPGEPYHRPNVRHVNCCQYSLDVLGFDFDGIVGFVDSDMFLIRPLSIVQEMEGYDIVTAGRCGGTSEHAIGHWWPGLCFMRMNKLPDKRTLSFNCGMVDGINTDTGGYSYYYAKAHPELKCKGIDEVWGYQLFCPDRFAPGGNRANLNAPVPVRVTKYKEFGFNKREIDFLLKQPDTIQFLLHNSFLHYRAGTNYDNQSHGYMNSKKTIIDDFLDEIINN